MIAEHDHISEISTAGDATHVDRNAGKYGGETGKYLLQSFQWILWKYDRKRTLYRVKVAPRNTYVRVDVLRSFRSF